MFCLFLCHFRVFCEFLFVCFLFIHKLPNHIFNCLFLQSLFVTIVFLYIILFNFISRWAHPASNYHCHYCFFCCFFCAFESIEKLDGWFMLCDLLFIWLMIIIFIKNLLPNRRIIWKCFNFGWPNYCFWTIWRKQMWNSSTFLWFCSLVLECHFTYWRC